MTDIALATGPQPDQWKDRVVMWHSIFLPEALPLEDRKNVRFQVTALERYAKGVPLHG